MRNQVLRALFLIASLLLAVVGSEAASEPPGSGCELTVHWFDATHELQGARGPVTELVRGLFETASVRLQWADSNDDLGPDAIAIILVPDPPPPRGGPAPVLGALSDHDHRQFAYVYFNPVLRAVGLGTPVHALSPDEGVIFWRALSRVIAHEIVHSLVPGGQHAESGIMSDHLTPVMLQSFQLGFDELTTCQVRRSLGAQESCARTRRPKDPR